MAAKRSEMDKLWAEVNGAQERIRDAPSRQEALDVAIAAVELSMRAMKLASDSPGKLEMKSKCNALLDQAEKIKNGDSWRATPPSPNAQGPSNIRLATTPEPPVTTTQLQQQRQENDVPFTQTAYRKDRPNTVPQVKNDRNPAELRTGHNVFEASTLPIPVSESADASRKRSNDSVSTHRKDGIPASSTPGAYVCPQVSPGHAGSVLTGIGAGANGPVVRMESTHRATAPQARQLEEPVSTRRRSTREETILLRSSRFSGSTFPPWKEDPDSEVFQRTPDNDQFTDTPDLSLSGHQKLLFDGWKRAQHALPPPSWRTHNQPGYYSAQLRTEHDSVDLVQHATTDCSVVASLCAIIARSHKGHRQPFAHRLFPRETSTTATFLSPNGKYLLKLNINGCDRQVVIDDRLPVSKTSHLLHIIDRNHPALLWPALVEKAYLKARGGYDFPGSNSATDLWILVGWIPEHMFLQRNDIDADILWKKMYASFQYHDVLITLGTGDLSTDVEAFYGLAEHHSYPVLDMNEAGEHRILTIKNPWFHGSTWKGSHRPTAHGGTPARTSGDSWPDPSPVANGSPSITAGAYAHGLHGQKELPPGTFEIKFEDVLQHFKTFYLNWNPSLFAHRQDIHFSWDLSLSETGQSIRDSSSCFIDRPQFQARVSGEDIVFLLLTRHFPNETPAHPASKSPQQTSSTSDLMAGFISLYVFDSGGRAVFLKDEYLDRAMYVDSPHTLLRTKLDAGKTYTVAPSEQDLPAIKHSFTLSVFASYPIHLEPASLKFAYTTSIQSAWAADTAGGNAHCSKYFQNPQFSLTTVAPGPIAVLLHTSVPGLNIHTKLIHARGQRTHKIVRRDIVTDSGQYRTGGALAETDDLDAGTYTIICSTFAEGQLGDFVLRVDSMGDAVLRQLPAENAGRLSMKLAECPFDRSTNKVACPIFPSRLARVSVVARFLRGYGFEATHTGPHAVPQLAGHPTRTRSPLRVTIETGRGPERIILVASGDGGYSDNEAGVRTDEVNLEPRMREQQDMWLVLDRLSGPSMPEEFYRVEVFTDVPAALKLGVWRNWDD